MTIKGEQPTRRLGLIAIVVPDYDSAIAFFVDGLGFALLEDVRESAQKRWVVVRPGEGGADLLLARAADTAQAAAIGRQTGGRVGFFLYTSDFHSDRARFEAAGAIFEETGREEPYGRVAVFRDPFGNRWDLIEPPTGRTALSELAGS